MNAAATVNDFVAVSHNAANDNKYNAKKARSTLHQFKRLLRPVMALLKGDRPKSTYRKSPQPEYFADEVGEADQNHANELLEQRICAEIDSCADFAAVPVFQDDDMQILPVHRGHHYIPVHFARTDAGTFFWTSVSAADIDICYDKFATSQYQLPESQVPCDRWAQA